MLLLAQSPHSSANSGGSSEGGISENGFDLILADHEPPKARLHGGSSRLGRDVSAPSQADAVRSHPAD